MLTKKAKIGRPDNGSNYRVAASDLELRKRPARNSGAFDGSK
jgi:hypothetical protein